MSLVRSCSASETRKPVSRMSNAARSTGLPKGLGLVGDEHAHLSVIQQVQQAALNPQLREFDSLAGVPLSCSQPQKAFIGCCTSPA